MRGLRRVPLAVSLVCFLSFSLPPPPLFTLVFCFFGLPREEGELLSLILLCCRFVSGGRRFVPIARQRAILAGHTAVTLAIEI